MSNLAIQQAIQVARDSELGGLVQILLLMPWPGRAGRAVRYGALGYTVYQKARELRREHQNRSLYTIRMDEDDDLYADVQQWLVERMTPSERKSLLAVAQDRKRSTDGAEPEYELSYSGMPVNSLGKEVVYYYDGRMTVEFAVGGHRIQAAIEREESPLTERSSLRARASIILTARSLAGQQALQDELQKIADRQALSRPPYILTGNYGGWRRTRPIRPRDPQTVVLAAGQMERISADLGHFLDNEAAYASKGLPWHRGYLLSGPPGTGKTTTVQVLAQKYRLDIYSLSLGEIKSDIDLGAMFNAVKDRSILLIEDIDAAHTATSRKQRAGDSASAAGLLNALDGISTPHGLVVFMTTNDKGALDPALVRKGRVDVSEELGYLDDRQAARLVEAMTGLSGPLPAIGDRRLTSAQLADKVKEHIADPEAARRAIVELLAQAA
jgi:Mrp family chromosome partitioning ATPase